jgi:hypothetical protein
MRRTIRRCHTTDVCGPLPQVDGCCEDLRSLKSHLIKARLCEGHHRASEFLLAGLQSRFCQQCGTVHK